MSGTTFTFGGVASTTYGIFVEKVHRPILPKTRDRLAVIATRDGEWDFGSYFESTKIELDCWIASSTRAALLTNTGGIASWLNPKTGAKALIISDQPSQQWNCKYSGELNLDDLIVGYAHFKMPFRCIDGAATSTSPVSVSSDTNSVGVTNSGIAAVPFKVTITNTSGSTLHHMTIHGPLGTTICSLAMAPADVLVVDFSNYSATMNGNSITSYISFGGALLPVGASTVTITDDESTNVHTTVSFTPVLAG